MLRAWGRLGYPRRAVALHRAAATIVTDPRRRACRAIRSSLRTLPGVGDYTAAAVASLAFGVPVAAIDTNVRRIWARVDHGMEPDEVRLASSLAAAATMARSSPPGRLEPGGDGSRSRGVPADDLAATSAPCAPGARSPPRAATAESSTPTPDRGSRGRCGRSEAPCWQRCAPARLARSAGSRRPRASIPNRVTEAVRGLSADGLATATPAALEGRRGGRVALADG